MPEWLKPVPEKDTMKALRFSSRVGNNRFESKSSPMKTNSMTRGIQCALAALGMMVASHAHAASVLGLGDLVRPPGAGANAYVLGVTNTPPSSISLTGSSMTFDSKAGYAVFYFKPVELANIGDYLSFEYTAKFTNFDIASGGVRIGLLKNPTPGTRLTADQNATTYTGFQNYAGYLGTYRATLATSGGLYRRGTGASSDLLGGGSLGGNGVTLSTTVSGFAISDATQFYSGSFSITRTAANEITVSSQFGGQIIYSGTDAGASIVTSFDTLALFTNRSTAGAASLEFNGFSITTNAIPEPNAAALVTGTLMASFLVVLFRRRRAARQVSHGGFV